MSYQQINSNLTNYIIQLAQQPNAKDSLNLLLNNLFDNSQKEKQEEDISKVRSFNELPENAKDMVLVSL